jgi:hypothetical protein
MPLKNTENFASLAFLLILLSSAMALSSEETLLQLQEAEQVIKELEENQLPSGRFQDMYQQAKFNYESQKALETVGGNPDYTLVTDLTSQILELKIQVFRVKDELDALEEYVLSLEGQGFDLTKVNQVFQEAKQEFQDERFEQSQEKIDLTYDEVSKSQALSTRVQAIYEANTKNISHFIESNWENILIGGTFLSIIGFVFNHEFATWRLHHEKNLLQMRKKVIQDLVTESQYQYFDTKEMNEETYHVRMIKFGKMIRDINRKIPTINEQLKKRKSFLQKMREFSERNKKQQAS